MHLRDMTDLYLILLKAILARNAPPSGKTGYYFAENGLFSWKALYQGIANRLAAKSLIADARLIHPDESAMAAIGKVLNCPVSFVPVQIAGE